MLVVFFEGIGVNEDVVDISDGKLVQIQTKCGVDIGLKGCGRICQPEWHDAVLEMAIAGPECGFPLVAQGDSKQIVRTSKVDLGIILGVFQAVEELEDKWKRISIFDGDAVEGAVVDAKA